MAACARQDLPVSISRIVQDLYGSIFNVHGRTGTVASTGTVGSARQDLYGRIFMAASARQHLQVRQDRAGPARQHLQCSMCMAGPAQ